MVFGPRQSFGGRFAPGGKWDIGLGGALCGDGEPLVGDIGEDHFPAALSEPKGVATGSSCKVEDAAWHQ